MEGLSASASFGILLVVLVGLMLIGGLMVVFSVNRDNHYSEPDLGNYQTPSGQWIVQNEVINSF